MRLGGFGRQFGVAALGASVAILCGCAKPTPPPPRGMFAGLPVSGSLDDARRAGFTACRTDVGTMRCRRAGVMLFGFGPFAAAVDLPGGGSAGFDQLTLWHDSDQDAFIPLGTALERNGWTMCLTGQGNQGNQAIYTKPGAPVRVLMDLSYYGKRRLRLVPVWNRKDGGC